MEKADDLSELLRHLGRHQRQINAELAKARPNRDKIAKAYAAGRDFAQAAHGIVTRCSDV